MSLHPALQELIDQQRRIQSLARDRALRAMLCRWVSEEEPTAAYDGKHRLIGLAARGRIVIRLDQPI